MSTATSGNKEEPISKSQTAPTPEDIRKNGHFVKVAEAIMASKADVNYRLNKVVRKWLESVGTSVDEKDSGKDIALSISCEARLARVPTVPIGFGFYLMANTAFPGQLTPVMNKMLNVIMSVPDKEFQDQMMSFLYDYKFQSENVRKVVQKRSTLLAGLMNRLTKTCRIHGVKDPERPLDSINSFMGSLKEVYINTYSNNMEKLVFLRKQMASEKVRKTISLLGESATLLNLLNASEEEEEEGEANRFMDPITKEMVETTEMIDTLHKARNPNNYVTVDYLESKMEQISKVYLDKKCRLEIAKIQLTEKEEEVKSVKDDHTMLRQQLYRLQNRLSQLQMQELKHTTSFNTLNRPGILFGNKIGLPGQDAETGKDLPINPDSKEQDFQAEIQMTEIDSKEAGQTLSQQVDAPETSQPEISKVQASDAITSLSEINLTESQPSPKHWKLAASRTDEKLQATVKSAISQRRPSLKNSKLAVRASRIRTEQNSLSKTVSTSSINLSTTGSSSSSPKKVTSKSKLVDSRPAGRGPAEDNENQLSELLTQFIDNSAKHATFLMDSLFQVRQTARSETHNMQLKYKKVQLIAEEIKKIIEEVEGMLTKLPELDWGEGMVRILNRLPLEHKCSVCLCQQAPVSGVLDSEEEAVKLKRSLLHCQRYEELVTGVKDTFHHIQEQLRDTLTVTCRAMQGLMWGQEASLEMCPGVFVTFLDSDKAVIEEVEEITMKPKRKERLLEHSRKVSKAVHQLTRLLVATLQNNHVRLHDMDHQRQFVHRLEERVRHIETELIRALLTIARKRSGEEVLSNSKLMACCRCPQCSCLVLPLGFLDKPLTVTLSRDLVRVQSWQQKMLGRTSLALRQATGNVMGARNVHGSYMVVSGVRPEVLTLTNDTNRIVLSMMKLRKAKNESAIQDQSMQDSNKVL